MTVSLSLFAGAGWQFFDNNGNVLSGGLLYSYEAGTTTPLATYTSSTGATANTNPIVLNAGGRPANEIWLDVSKTAKFILKDSLGSTIGTWDNIPSIVSAFNLSGTNNGVAYFNSSGVFGSSANFTFDGSNAAVSGEMTVGTDAHIGGDVDVGGNSVVTGNSTVTGTIASTGGLTSATPAVTQTAGDNSTKIATTAFVQNNLKSAILPLTASVASNQLTLTLAPTRLDFRSPTLSDGSISTVSSSTLTLTVPNGTTLGTANGIASRLVVLAVYDGSTVQLAVNNLAGGLQLDETNLVTTTTSGSSITAVYAASAVTNKPYRVVGLVDITEATAGTWATAPTTVQGIGGEALAALSSFGYGQDYHYGLTRVKSTVYYNTYNKPMMVSITTAAGETNASMFMGSGTPSVNPCASFDAGASGGRGFLCMIVPPGYAYKYTANLAPAAWVEFY